MIHSSVQNNITILNFYAPNKIASKYTEKILIALHGEINYHGIFRSTIDPLTTQVLNYTSLHI